MTSDGIPTSEWDQVHELALEIVNATMRDDDVLADSKTEALLWKLRVLRSQYGDLPSILGTLADYTENEIERYELYAKGIATARQMNDEKNLVLLLESILELESLDDDQRRFWTAHLDALKPKRNG